MLIFNVYIGTKKGRYFTMLLSLIKYIDEEKLNILAFICKNNYFKVMKFTIYILLLFNIIR